jgi:hypothetical protein
MHYERFFGRRADANFCVTRAMQEWLQQEWGITYVPNPVLVWLWVAVVVADAAVLVAAFFFCSL